MPVYIHLKLNVETGLNAKLEKAAAKRGTSVERFAAQLLEEAADRITLLLDEPVGKKPLL
jgi:hypothetical protein